MRGLPSADLGVFNEGLEVAIPIDVTVKPTAKLMDAVMPLIIVGTISTGTEMSYVQIAIETDMHDRKSNKSKT
jgi:hypothetical protein